MQIFCTQLYLHSLGNMAISVPIQNHSYKNLRFGFQLFDIFFPEWKEDDCYSFQLASVCSLPLWANLKCTLSKCTLSVHEGFSLPPETRRWSDRKLAASLRLTQRRRVYKDKRGQGAYGSAVKAEQLMACLSFVSVYSLGGNGNRTARMSLAGDLRQRAECWPRSPPPCSSSPSKTVSLKRDPVFGGLLWNHICGKWPPYFDFTLDFLVVTGVSMGIRCQQPSMSYCWPHTHTLLAFRGRRKSRGQTD